MSRVGKESLALPSTVKYRIDGSTLVVKSPKHKVRSVEITTPIPKAAIVARRLGVSESRFKILSDIATGRLKAWRGDTLVGALRLSYGDSFLKGWRSDAPLKAVEEKTGKNLIRLLGDHETRKAKNRPATHSSKTGRHAETTAG